MKKVMAIASVLIFILFLTASTNLASAADSCTFAISPTSQSFDASGGTGSVTVTSSASSCAWTATSNDPWIMITSGSSGTGNGTVGYSVSVNSGSSLRTGTLTVADQVFQINQGGLVAEGYFLIDTWGSSGSGDGQFNYPLGVAVDSAGFINAVDNGNSRVQKFDSAGKFITKWGSSGTGNGQFSYPSSIAVDALGNIFIADTNNSRIQKFDRDGNFLSWWGMSGSDNGQFNNPSAVAADTHGNVYVADAGNRRIQKFDASGNFITNWDLLAGDGIAGFMAVDSSDDIYIEVTHWIDGCWGYHSYPPAHYCYYYAIKKYDGNGNFFSEVFSDQNPTDSLGGIAFDSSDILYLIVNDLVSGNSRVQRIDLHSNLIDEWLIGSAAADLGRNRAITVDSSGYVYVSDYGSNSIKKFAPTSRTAPIYRFNTGTSFLFTISVEEKNAILQNYPQFILEGTAFYAYVASQVSTLPVYRFNLGPNGYLFTISESEKDYVVTNYPQYVLEGIAFYAYPEGQTGTLPVYRFNREGQSYLYTMSEDEKNSILVNYPQYVLEGVAFYAYPLPH